MNLMLNYTYRDSFIHNLNGVTKLICLILWCITTMITYDTRILLFMIIFSIYLFKLSKINIKDVMFVIVLILIFLVLNNLLIYIFSPLTGVEIYKSKTILIDFNNSYSITLQQLFYQLNITLKYFSIIPISLLFILTTEPSEFASSLNKIGVNYKVSYSVSLALRYMPDIIKNYKDLSIAKQARGIDLSKNEKLFKRTKNTISILVPIILSSIEKIEKISCAMELRSFGYKKYRTWYNNKDFKKEDVISIILISFLVIIALIFLYLNKGRFFNPFI